MKETRVSIATGPAIATAIFLAVLIPYTAGYYLLGKIGTLAIPEGMVRVRSYRHQWQSEVYRPAAKVESLLTGREVWTGYVEE
jgi:hypothetical protein